jgi:DNA-binding transcriptional regulator YdaS (Cro superfamily)
MSKSLLQVASKMRGLYNRVADKLGVDPSYVSRVARGERRSPKIEVVLDREVSRILTSISRPKAKEKKK